EDSPLSKAAKRRQVKARKTEGPLQEQQNTPDVVTQPQQATAVASGTAPALAPPIRTPNNPLVDSSRAAGATAETTTTWTSVQSPTVSISARVPRRERSNVSQNTRSTLARSLTRAPAPPIPSRVSTLTHNPHNHVASRATEAITATSSRPTASAWLRPLVPQPATSLTRVPPQEPSSQNFRPAWISQSTSRTSGPTSAWSSPTSPPSIPDPIYVDWVDSDSDDEWTPYWSTYRFPVSTPDVTTTTRAGSSRRTFATCSICFDNSAEFPSRAPTTRCTHEAT
ncbi:hypothetical protein FRC07_009785, partial [Ceratobasidium sp. 392]